MGAKTRTECSAGRSAARQSVLCVGGTVLGAFLCASALAQGTGAGNVHPALQDRWSLQVGIFVPDVKTTASLNGAGGRVNAKVDFEQDLDLKDRDTLPAILASVRLGHRWKIEAEYFALNRSASAPLSRTISWGDNTYTVGTTVSSTFDSDIYRLSAGYALLKSNEHELGVALGAFVTDFDASISAPGIGTSAGDTLAPLPTIGLYGAYALSSKWLFSGRMDYFFINYDDYEGDLINVSAGIDYRFTRHFAAGLAYRYVDYDLNVSDSSYSGDIEYRFNGPMFYITASF